MSHLLRSVLLTCLLVGIGSARAGETANGQDLNGSRLNGITLNGFGVNGTQLNRLAFNGTGAGSPRQVNGVSLHQVGIR